MNERIKQLAELSKTPKTMMVDGVLQSVVTIDAERFADLIVRECIAICQDIDGEDNIDARSGRQDCAAEIKEHFGDL